MSIKDKRFEKSFLSRSICRATFGALVTSSIAFSLPANAQLALEELVVTAQKREESLQDVPLAVSALGESALEQSGFDGVDDLSFMVPSLQFGNFGPTTFLNIRGIGSENTTGGSDPGVSMHVDGVYVGRPVGALFSAFDVERVEVLRGPQGTLYGRNATGGSVNLITRKPDDEFGGKVDLTLGDYNHVRLRGSVNLPISDAVQARIVAFNEDRDGFTENTFAGGTEANDADSYGVRGHINFDLSDRGSLLLSATHINNGGVGSQPEQRDPFTTGVLFGPPPAAASMVDENANFVINDLTAFRESKDTAESQDNEFTMVNATLEWDFDNFTVKSITAYLESSYDSTQDNDSSSSFAAQTVLNINEQADQVTQEIQFLSTDDSAFQWIAGLYYFNEDVTRRSTLTGQRFALLETILGIAPTFDIGGDIETTSFAAFAQSTFDLSDSLALTVGLRYTDDEKEGFNINRFFSPAFVTDPVATDSTEVTGKVALDWKFSDSSLLYASFAHGYKSGGVNQTTVAATGANPIFNPEFVDTLEIGLKSRLLEDRVQLNLAAYTNDYTDLQFQVFGAFGPESGNAGEATINGFEAELQALVSETWSIDGSLALTNATYDTLVTGPGLDFSGNDLPRTPDLTYNLGITGEWDLESGSNLRARLEGSYTDEMFYEFKNGPESLTEDYYNLNFRLFWTSPDETFTTEFYVTNLTDEIQENNILVGFTLGVAQNEVGQEFTSYNAPRQVGVTVGYNF